MSDKTLDEKCLVEMTQACFDEFQEYKSQRDKAVEELKRINTVLMSECSTLSGVDVVQIQSVIGECSDKEKDNATDSK